MSSIQSLKSGAAFWSHTLAVIGTWVAPFLVDWWIAVGIYAAVMIQFAVFGKCLMNEHHGLDESGGRIFYTDLLERMGFNPDPLLVKTIVRKWLYPALSVVAIVWQLVLGNSPVLGF